MLHEMYVANNVNSVRLSNTEANKESIVPCCFQQNKHGTVAILLEEPIFVIFACKNLYV